MLGLTSGRTALRACDSAWVVGASPLSSAGPLAPQRNSPGHSPGAGCTPARAAGDAISPSDDAGSARSVRL